MDAKIILGKCAQCGDVFGMRVEYQNNDWVRTWAFKISQHAAMSEGYDNTQIVGSFIRTKDYPGCPYCGNMEFVRCQCGKNTCTDGSCSPTNCRWCGTYMDNMKIVNSMSVDSGSF